MSTGQFEDSQARGAHSTFVPQSIHRPVNTRFVAIRIAGDLWMNRRHSQPSEPERLPGFHPRSIHRQSLDAPRDTMSRVFLL
jgi:hypothetical protein